MSTILYLIVGMILYRIIEEELYPAARDKCKWHYRKYKYRTKFSAKALDELKSLAYQVKDPVVKETIKGHICTMPRTAEAVEKCRNRINQIIKEQK